MSNLLGRGVISRQENDTAQAQYAAQQANVQALEKAAAAMRSSVSAAEANLARLNQIKTYQTVRAPFDGVITLRNVDTGALVNEGSTLLFRIAQTGTLRTYLNVPQGDAESVKPGQRAIISITDIAGRKFTGTVTRTVQRARSRHPHPAHRSAGAESRTAPSCPGCMPRSISPCRAKIRRCSSPAIRWWCAAMGRRWPWCSRMAPCISRASSWAAISAIGWKCSPACRKASGWPSIRATRSAKA